VGLVVVVGLTDFAREKAARTTTTTVRLHQQHQDSNLPHLSRAAMVGAVVVDADSVPGIGGLVFGDVGGDDGGDRPWMVPIWPTSTSK
jgi:hypothetical protein